MQALKPGGRLVYSTCSIAKIQNDDVVSAVLAHPGLPEACEAVVPDMALFSPAAKQTLHDLGAEATQHGWMVLPDQTGSGPIYVACLRKLIK